MALKDKLLGNNVTGGSKTAFQAAIANADAQAIANNRNAAIAAYQQGLASGNAAAGAAAAAQQLAKNRNTLIAAYQQGALSGGASTPAASTSTGTGATLPFKVSEGTRFTGANDAQRATLQNAANIYASGGDWQSAVNGLRTNGDFVSYTDENGLPVGALRSVSGVTNGEYLWALNGQMTDSTVPTGTVLYSADGSRWVVGAGGSLSSAPVGTAVSGPGSVGAIGATEGLAQAAATAKSAQTAASTAPAAAPAATTTPAAQTTPAQATPAPAATTMTPATPTMPAATSIAATSAPAPTFTPDVASVPEAAQGTTPYQAALNAYDYGPAPEWNGSEYERQRDEYLQRAANSQFSYDPAADPAWQAYQKQYAREGQRAIQDTLGQYAAMTGGAPSSYAVSAATQAGDYYAAQLTDKLPQLYNDAYNRYLQDYQRMLGLSQEYGALGQTDYNRYLDQLGQYNTDRNFQYGLNRDAVSDARYDQEWAQNLREYANEQGWKSAEWQQYLREYGDRLSEADRQWVYQMARDAVSDARYADETAYNRAADSRDWQQYLREYGDRLGETEHQWAYQQARDAVSDARYADETAYDRAEDAQDWAQYLREYEDEQRSEGIREAITVSEFLGYVPQRYAEVLGIPAGTSTDSAVYRAATGSAGDDAGESAEPKQNGGTVSFGKSGSSVKTATAVNGSADLTSLDYDQDEGIFHWSGKDYGSLGKLAKDVEAAGLSESQLQELSRKLRKYGFAVSFG